MGIERQISSLFIHVKGWKVGSRIKDREDVGRNFERLTIMVNIILVIGIPASDFTLSLAGDITTILGSI